jgi:diaminopimelate epimerase
MGLSLLTKRSSELALYLYSGSGNRFFISDSRNLHFPIVLVPKLCNEYALDGVILLEKSLEADYSMRIFNADGSLAEMCGNGLRCLMQFLIDRGHSGKPVTFETPAGIYTAQQAGNEISIRMRAPKRVKWKLPFLVENHQFDAAYLEVGVPHLILFFEEISSEILEKSFEVANEDKTLFPTGANVSGVQVLPNNEFLIRTFERGVGRETGACGTGATAAALAISQRFQFSSPLTAIPTSKEPLTIFFNWEGVKPWGIYLKGPVQRELSVNYPTLYNLIYDK